MCNENSNFVMYLNYNNVSDERTWIRIHSNKPVIQRGLGEDRQEFSFC